MQKATKLQDLLKVCRPYPLEKEDFDNFHIETSEARGSNPAIMLTDYFESLKDEPQKVLFMGHRGSGKTTELWQVRKNLEASFFVISFSIREETDIIDLKYMDLIFIILNQLIEKVKESDIKLNVSLIDNLYNYWNDEKIKEITKKESYNVDVSAEAKLDFLSQLILSAKGVLSTGKETKETIRRHIEPKLSILISLINDLIIDVKEQLKVKNKVPIIIIEDLDKLEIPIAEDLFLNYRNILTSLNVHIIYTFPIFLRYSTKFDEISESFDNHELLSMIKINNKDGNIYQKGRDVLKEIVIKRANENLFDDGVLDFIIEKTGGVLRNIFEIIKTATLSIRSKDRNATKINMESAKSAYGELKSDFERKITRLHLDKLRELSADTQKTPLSDDVLKELLYSTCVIEYNGKRWCDLHPAVKDILIERNQTP